VAAVAVAAVVLLVPVLLGLVPELQQRLGSCCRRAFAGNAAC
jgi:hypothetical protein